MELNSYYYGDNTVDYSAGVQVVTGPTTLVGISFNLTSAAVVGIIDGTSGTTPNVAKFKASPSEGFYSFPYIRLANGLRIVTTTGAHLGNITVIYR